MAEKRGRFIIEVLPKQSTVGEIDPLQSPDHRRHRSIEVSVKIPDEVGLSPSRSHSYRFLPNIDLQIDGPETSRSHNKDAMGNFISSKIQKCGRFSIRHEITGNNKEISNQPINRSKISVRKVTLEPSKTQMSDYQSNRNDSCLMPGSPHFVNDLIDF